MVMRWLTRQWLHGALTEAETDARLDQCRSHHEALLPRLPPGLRLLLGEQDELGYITLHDGAVEWWASDGSRSLTLELVCGNEQVHYRRVLIQYRGRVELVGADEHDLRRWLNDLHTEFLYDEVDVLSDGRFEHRHLLSNDEEFGVRFEDIVVVSAPLSVSALREYWRRRRFEFSSAYVRLVWAHAAGRELAWDIRRHLSNLAFAVDQLRHRGDDDDH